MPASATVPALARSLRAALLAVMLLLSALSATSSAATPAGEPFNDEAIDVVDAADVDATRARLVDFVWGADGFPASRQPLVVPNVPSPVSGLVNLGRVEELHVPMESGVTGMAYHFVPAGRANGRLLVVHQGHLCSLQDSIGVENAGTGVQRTIAGALARGYGVLGVFMPRRTPEDCGGRHGDLFQLASPSAGSSIQYFLEPTAVALNHVSSGASEKGFAPYREFAMLGLSGGGWTTVVYSAIDTRITRSVSVAGTIPLYLRQGGSVGDEEQVHQPLYSIAGYPDLYVLGAVGTDRLQVNVHLRRDSCCFGAAPSQTLADERGQTFDEALAEYEQRVQTRVAEISHGSFAVVVDDTAPSHRITLEALDAIVWPTLAHPTDEPAPPDSPREFPLETFLSGAPSAVTSSRDAVLTLSANVPTPTFQCRVDGGEWTSCLSPFELTDLPEGPHSVFVRSNDRTGATDPTPAVASWVVDDTPPTSAFSDRPPEHAGDAVRFAFAADEEATFACALDDSEWLPCASPVEFSGLSEGRHRFRVRATDLAGNEQLEPLPAGWVVRIPPPANPAPAASPEQSLTATPWVAPLTEPSAAPRPLVAASPGVLTLPGLRLALTAAPRIRLRTGSVTIGVLAASVRTSATVRLRWRGGSVTRGLVTRAGRSQRVVLRLPARLRRSLPASRTMRAHLTLSAVSPGSGRVVTDARAVEVAVRR